MQLVDARRLTGPNLLARTPLVVVELALAGDHAEARARYLSELARMRVALGLIGEVAWLERPHAGGLVIGYPETIDVLLACTEMSEWAALSAIEVLAGRAPLSIEERRVEIAAMLARERNPRLLALASEAARRDVPLLWDDETVSLGMGWRSLAWARDALPEADAVPWERLGRIPVALVTGTNGKTTTTRLLARIAREAGKRVASTSSDSIAVGTEDIDVGDWTGPAAARVVLRRPDVDFAVLETARGGILRRGLAVDRCDVAIVTNVSDDHVGEYGIDDLDAMARAKAVTIAAAHTAVLNANDPRLVALAATHARPVFFADLEDGFPERDGVFASGGRIVSVRDGVPVEIASIASIPITFGGAARFNVENVLGVVAAALALELPVDAIRRGLQGFTAGENRRRSIVLDRDGVRLVLDFGHNPEGLRAIMKLVRSLRGESSGRLTTITGSAGDRSDREIGEMARVLFEAAPDRVIVREVADYLRGRAPGEVPEVFRRAFLELGLPAAALTTVDSEVEALRLALADAKPGDFVVLLIHLEEDDVRNFLADRQNAVF